MLTSKKRAFAESLLAGKSQTESAVSAGYSENTAKQAGYKLARDKDVLDHINRMKNHQEKSKPQIEKKAEEVTKRKMTYLDPMDFLRDVMNDDSEDKKIRADAAKSMLPYVHAKIGEQGKKETQQNKAKNATDGFYSAAKPPKVRTSLN